MNDSDSSQRKQRRLSHKQRAVIFKLTELASLAVALAIIVFPVYWMIATALKQSSEIYTTSTPLVPVMWTLENFESVLTSSNFLTYYFNSVVVALGVVAITLVASTLGGYGLARIDIPHKKTFARGILFGYMFPAFLLSIPMFILWRQIGILNTRIGLILAETAVSLPFSLWIMWKFFQTVPVSLEESALSAGATRFQAMLEIALPLAKPGMIAVAVFAYAVSWNQYTMPKILMIDQEYWPLTVGLATFISQDRVFWGEMMAAITLALIPSFLFVFFLQKYLLRGFRAGGVG